MTNDLTQIGRRAFLQGGSLLMLGGPMTIARAAERQFAVADLTVGLVTDLHHADKPTAGSRHYRETLTKLTEAVDRFTTDRPDFVVELGDFIDAADTVDVELGYLRQVSEVFDKIPVPKHYVLGNHCVDTLTKSEFLSGVGAEESYYSFDRGGFHFVVLDSCFRSDGVAYGRKNSTWTDANVPDAELAWLRSDLQANSKPVIVFAHQRLDDAGVHAVRNAAAVRAELESAGQVVAVFQGHSHSNAYQQIGGIHYCTLVAMIEGSGLENSGYSMLHLHADGTLRLNGFRNQADRQWPSAT